MDPPDDAFSDALDYSPFHPHHSPEPSPPVSVLFDPDSPPASPSTTLRRRAIRRRSLVTESASQSDLIDGEVTSSPKHRNREISNKNEVFSEKRYSDKGKVGSFPSSPSVVAKEKDDESTLTTAASDDALVDTAESATELVVPPSNPLDYVAGLVIGAILFQIKIFIWLLKFPMVLTFHACMLFLDPFGTMRKGKGIFMWVLGKAWFCAFGSNGLRGVFKGQNSFWNVAFKCGWGFLWSIYVCCILLALAVSSIVFSGFVVKGFVEKPIQMRQVLNFDYTRQSPVAFVPITSCAGAYDPEREVAASKWVGPRVLPHNKKVHATVSLVVPESGYNRNLGVFQIRADYLSSGGKTIASLSQPCMLKFSSEPIRLFMTFLKIVPLVTGYISETQTLNVKIKGFVEGDVPTSCLKVTLEQRAEYLPGAGIPQIYDSSVIIESELPLLKRIMWHWKFSVFIWIAMMAFMTQFFFVLVCCWPIIIPRTRPRRGPARRTVKSKKPRAPN